MKTKLTSLALIASLFAFGDPVPPLTISGTFYIGSGATVYADLPVVITNAGIENHGLLVLNNGITGAELLQMESDGSLELNAGTLTLSNESDEAFLNLTIGAGAVVEVTPGNSLTLTGDLTNNNTTDGIKLLADNTGYAQL